MSVKSHSWPTYLLLVIVLAVTILCGVAWGEVNLPLSRAVRIAMDGLLQRTAGDYAPWEATILLQVRLPRVLVAALAGGGLALTGCVMQGVFRNPMADPGVLGISSGASLGAVAVLYSGAAAGAAFLVPVAAFAGALVCAFLVYVIATAKARSSLATLLLAGVAIGSICTAMTSFILTMSLRRWEVGRQILAWTLGNLEGRTWPHVAFLAPLVLGGCLWLITYSRLLNVLMTGEDHALAVGVDVTRTRRHLLFLTSLVTAGIVAVVGVVSFVGLLVPHFVRLVAGSDNRRLLGYSFIIGAAFMVLADTLCRASGIQDLRLGVITAFLGGGCFLFLLLKMRHRSYSL